MKMGLFYIMETSVEDLIHTATIRYTIDLNQELILRPMPTVVFFRLSVTDLITLWPISLDNLVKHTHKYLFILYYVIVSKVKYMISLVCLYFTNSRYKQIVIRLIGKILPNNNATYVISHIKFDIIPRL